MRKYIICIFAKIYVQEYFSSKKQKILYVYLHHEFPKTKYLLSIVYPLFNETVFNAEIYGFEKILNLVLSMKLITVEGPVTLPKDRYYLTLKTDFFLPTSFKAKPSKVNKVYCFNQLNYNLFNDMKWMIGMKPYPFLLTVILTLTWWFLTFVKKYLQ